MTGRRQGYYPRPVPTAASAPVEPPSPANDVEPLIGTDAIAAVLKIEPEQLKSLLYPASRREKIGMPIRKLPGLGLGAEKRELLAWWRSYLSGQPVAARR